MRRLLILCGLAVTLVACGADGDPVQPGGQAPSSAPSIEVVGSL